MSMVVFLLVFIGGWIALAKWMQRRGQRKWLALAWTGPVMFSVAAVLGAWTDGALVSPVPPAPALVVAARPTAPTVAHPAPAPAPATSAEQLAAQVRANATPCEKVVDQVRTLRHNIGDAVCMLTRHGETLRLELKGGALRPSPAMVDTFATATASLLRAGAEAKLWPAGVDLQFAMTAVRADASGRPDARPDGSLRQLAVLELTFPAKERGKLTDAALSPGGVLDIGHPRILEREIVPTLLDYCTGAGAQAAPVFCRRIDAAIAAG
ncbi:MAG: hypothetical protein ACTHJ9_05380 [Rhodanobacter sp.]